MSKQKELWTKLLEDEPKITGHGESEFSTIIYFSNGMSMEVQTIDAKNFTINLTERGSNG